MKHVLAVKRSAPQMIISASPNGTPNAPNSTLCTPGLACLICIQHCHFKTCKGKPPLYPSKCLWLLDQMEGEAGFSTNVIVNSATVKWACMGCCSPFSQCDAATCLELEHRVRKPSPRVRHLEGAHIVDLSSHCVAKCTSEGHIHSGKDT